MFHYLRIAVTAFSVTACVLLVALWVRSYWWLTTYANDYISFTTADGVFQLTWLNDPSLYDNGWTNISMEEFNRMAYGSATRPVSSASKLLPNFGLGPLWLVIPIWFLVIVAGAFAIFPWIHWSKRFSLRTLLIATTLVAMGLGTIIYFSG
jgi:hypothetical protein